MEPHNFCSDEPNSKFKSHRKILKVLFQFQKAFLMHIPQGTKDFFVKRFRLEEGSITDTEVGRRHHPKLFGKYRHSFWAKFTTKNG